MTRKEKIKVIRACEDGVIKGCNSLIFAINQAKKNSYFCDSGINPNVDKSQIGHEDVWLSNTCNILNVIDKLQPIIRNYYNHVDAISQGTDDV